MAELLQRLATEYGLLIALLIIANICQASAIVWLVRIWRTDMTDSSRKFSEAMQSVAASNRQQAEALNLLANGLAEMKGVISQLGR
jgi:hypothetical protein